MDALSLPGHDEAVRRLTGIRLVALFLTGALAAILFGWASLGWFAHDQTDDSDPGSGGISFYSNDPAALVDIAMDLRPSGAFLEGSVTISLTSLSDPENFSWALVGSRSGFFEAKAPGDAQWSIAPATNHARECGDVPSVANTLVVPAEADAALLGTASRAGYVGTNLAMDAVLGVFFFDIRLPSAPLVVEGESYTLAINIGRPVDLSFGEITFAQVRCIRLDTSPDMQPGDAPFVLRLSPRSSEDQLASSDPVSERSGSYERHLRQADLFKATYRDAELVRLHATALFMAGVFAGVSATFLVSVFEHAIQPRTNRQQSKSRRPTRNRRK